MQTEWTTLNASITATPGVIHLDPATFMAGDAGQLESTFSYDKRHWNDVGMAYYTTQYAPAISGVCQ